jgi:hypothetical protein
MAKQHFVILTLLDDDMVDVVDIVVVVGTTKAETVVVQEELAKSNRANPTNVV